MDVYCDNNGAIAQAKEPFPYHISDPNTYSSVSTLFVRSLREMLRYVEFILMTMLLIL